MFGRLSWRIDTQEGRVHGLLFGAKLQRDRTEELERKVKVLTEALEWHVGTSLKIMGLEEELIRLRVAEAKKRGKTFGEQGDEVARQVFDGINQSVEQKLNDQVSPDTDTRQDSGE